jgi:glucose-6-phosphate 1-dehydrogenase
MKKIITIFGSTGNLMYKKLMPALSVLIEKNHLPKDTEIYCVARKDCTLDDYIEEAKNEVTSPVNWDLLVPYLTYIKMDIDNIDDYMQLNEKIKTNGKQIDKMFYLAVPPNLFPLIAKGISESKLIEKNDDFSRIVFEKPFGEDLESAKKINNELWKYFDEKQIYRIDHYLGKEMIQNILVVRFANSIFEETWDKSSIGSIVIMAKEVEGVLKRGNYYDKIGALKDMVQSHLMQMVSLITMERPKSNMSKDVKDEKVKVLKKLKINPENVILGQYKGYLDAEKVEVNSKTETFVYAKAFIENERWEKVPIHLLTGKMLDEKRSEIIINFKSKQTNLFKKSSNKLVIRVSPEEGVNFVLNVKEPGLSDNVVSAVLDYCHACKHTGNTPEAYEKLLLDLINKQDALFTRWDEIETSWKIIGDIKKHNYDLLVYDNYQNIKEKINHLNKEVPNDL